MYVINKYGFALKVYFKAIARVRQHRYFLYSKKKLFLQFIISMIVQQQK